MKRDPLTADVTFGLNVAADALFVQALLTTHPDVQALETFHDEGDESQPPANFFYVWLTDEARKRLGSADGLLAAIAAR